MGTISRSVKSRTLFLMASWVSSSIARARYSIWEALESDAAQRFEIANELAERDGIEGAERDLLARRRARHERCARRGIGRLGEELHLDDGRKRHPHDHRVAVGSASIPQERRDEPARVTAKATRLEEAEHLLRGRFDS